MPEKPILEPEIKGRGDITISVKHCTEQTPVRFIYKAGDSLEEAIQREGKDIVYANYLAGLKKDARDYLTRLVNKTSKNGTYTGPSSEDAIMEMQTWRPKAVMLRTKKSEIDKLLADKSPEELDALIEELETRKRNGDLS